MRRALTIVLLVVGALLALPQPAAQAAARVSVANADGAAVIDGRYSTTLTVRGSGFQSVQGGHGGVYVFFGTVSGGWRPSQGGVAGADYSYVPDSEARDNQGFQKYVAFPGSDTAGSANGGQMSASGSWSTTVVVPGPTFQARDRNGNVRTVDCRKVTCGVITIGAHGVANANNETFTPVRVGEVGAAGTPETTAPESTTTAVPGTETGTDRPRRAPKVPPALEVDRASASAGNVLAFSGEGLPPRAQVSAILDDGAAGAGPFLVGDDGRLAGVITIPGDIEPGTHELRLYGIEDPPEVRFAITSAAEPAAEPEAAPVERTADETDWAPILFAGGAGLVFLLALTRVLVRRRGVRRADA